MYQVKVRCREDCSLDDQVVSRDVFLISMLPSFDCKVMHIGSVDDDSLVVPIDCPNCGFRRGFIICEED